MQLSNGLADPVGLWLGHLMFDSIFCVLIATLIIIIFAGVSNQFHGLGFFVSAITNANELSWTRLTHFLGSVACIGVVWHRRRFVLLLRLAGRNLAPSRLCCNCRLSNNYVHRKVFTFREMAKLKTNLVVSCGLLAGPDLCKNLRCRTRSCCHPYVVSAFAFQLY